MSSLAVCEQEAAALGALEMPPWLETRFCVQSKEWMAVCEGLYPLLQVIPAQGGGLIARPDRFKLADLQNRRCEVVGGFLGGMAAFLAYPICSSGCFTLCSFHRTRRGVQS